MPAKVTEVTVIYGHPTPSQLECFLQSLCQVLNYERVPYCSVVPNGIRHNDKDTNSPALMVIFQKNFAFSKFSKILRHIDGITF